MILTRHCVVLLAAVVLLVVIQSELSAVVAATDQISQTALVAVVPAAVTRAVTVSLPLVTGLLGSTTSLTVVVPATTPLARRRLQDQGGI